jgi:hypothetical protein
MPISDAWCAKIEAAQKLAGYLRDGKYVRRLAYGQEKDDKWESGKFPCHDCAIVQGQLHVPGCDVEECPVCGGQLITCDCEIGTASATESTLPLFP